MNKPTAAWRSTDAPMLLLATAPVYSTRAFITGTLNRVWTCCSGGSNTNFVTFWRKDAGCLVSKYGLMSFSKLYRSSTFAWLEIIDGGCCIVGSWSIFKLGENGSGNRMFLGNADNTKFRN